MPKNLQEIPEDVFRDLVGSALRDAPSIPPSTYRIQLNSKFTFKDARAILGYLHELGVSAVYFSPYLEAKLGSPHGYDVVNPSRLNPELGTESDYEDLCAELKKLGMKHIFDMVPNHMGIGSGENDMWQDVLENGPSSIYAHHFDINWDSEHPGLKDKVLIPILGDHYGKVLENQEIRLIFDETRGMFFARYWEHKLPITPKTYPLILKHILKKFDKKDKDSKFIFELKKIYFLCKQLPDRDELDIDRILERNYEKEIAKERLAKLVQNNLKVRSKIEEVIELFNGEKEDLKSFDLMDELLDAQAYRVAFWRVAADEINYRRFFDINELAAIRMEDSRVFDFYHEFVFKLIREGKVDGMRIDHPDGLYDPPDYFKRLQFERAFQLVLNAAQKEGWVQGDLEKETLRTKLGKFFLNTGEKSNPLYVVVEKILDQKESLPRDWRVHGTVGYDFLNAVNGIFVDWDQGSVFDDIYENFTGIKFDFDQATYEKKKYIALVHMSSEINTLAQRLDHISENTRRYRDFTRNNLTVAIREVVACFPVYRTYIAPDVEVVSERDEQYIHIAIEKAKSKTPSLAHSVYDFLRDILLLRLAPGMDYEEERKYRDFILRFQQLTGPIMAKGLEDTTFYFYNRLISLNEVGGDPEHFGVALGEFHRQNQARLSQWPAGFITTSTHDTKRSEDVRMKINVLSEIPLEWQAELTKWSKLNEKYKTLVGEEWFPEANTEYFIYQTLIGVWPYQSLAEDEEDLKNRIWACVEKSIRESKAHTNWVNPNTEYEEGVKKFLFGILSSDKENHFPEFFIPFQKRVASGGMLNMLSALVMKIISPGVLDVYQGTEVWDDSLVDPDNRRPVDFKYREAELTKLKKEFKSAKEKNLFVEKLLDQKEDGRIKQFLLWKGLNLRKQVPNLLLQGSYVPLEVQGELSRYIVAIMRVQSEGVVVGVAARYFNELKSIGSDNIWDESKIILPEDFQVNSLQDIFSEKNIPIRKNKQQTWIDLNDLFQGKRAFSILTNSEVK